MLRAITTISEFDDRYTARDGGYRDGADYYDRAGSRHVLDRIAVPTRSSRHKTIHSFLHNVHRGEDSEASPYHCGRASLWGHCGFYQGKAT
ncbi:MAG: hypothetical protein IPK92_22210 [Nitrospira sp.]|nr:hypothetical protein [Nitrospira sp.]